MNGGSLKRQYDQSGMVSFVVTLIMMLVISLIVLGFAQISRREQAQSLDRQLSTQAFLAAETGVNDVRNVVKSQQATGLPVQDKSSCGPDANYTSAVANPDLDVANGVSYSCLLVSTRLKDIKINPLTSSGDFVNIPLEPAIGTIDTLHINWNALTNPSSAQVATKCKNNVPGSGTFPSSALGGWSCPYGVLRMDIVPTDSLNRAAMTTGQKTMFFYPTQGGSAANVGYGAANGAVVRMDCKPPTGCDVDVSGMSSSGSTKYALRFGAIYVDGSVDVTADDAGGAPLELKNAQVMVDSTGKARDVLRRIQVRLPLSPSGKTPNYAIQSGSSICKRFEITSDTFSIPNDIHGQDQNNPMCQSMSVSPPVPTVCSAGKHDIMLTLDYSHSMRDEQLSGASKEQRLKEVISTFIDKSGVSPAGNHDGLVTFNDNINIPSPLVIDPVALKNTVSVYPVNLPWGTRIAPALAKSQQELTSANSRAGVKDVIVLFTDGIPSPVESKSTIDAAAATMKTTSTDVYVIGLINAGSREDILQNLVANNGTYSRATNLAELQSVFDVLASKLQCTP